MNAERIVENPLRFTLTHDQRIKANMAWLKGEAPHIVAKGLGVDPVDLIALAQYERWPRPKGVAV